MISEKGSFDKLLELLTDLKDLKLKPIWIEKINVSNFFHIEYILWDKLN